MAMKRSYRTNWSRRGAATVTAVFKEYPSFAFNLSQNYINDPTKKGTSLTCKQQMFTVK
jgi:hypothetical protein